MNLPKNTNLPFFAYGIFKPGQMACKHLEPYIDTEKSTRYRIKGRLAMRDGLLLLDPKIKIQEIEGYKIQFLEGKEQEAYEQIMEKEPEKFYKWNEGSSKNLGINFLELRSPKKGIDKEYKTSFIDTDKIEKEEYLIGFEDPFFSLGLGLLDEKLEFNTNNIEFNIPNASLFRGLFKNQMRYLLLCTIVERFAFMSIKFNNATTKAWNAVGNMNAFRISFNKMKKEFNLTDEILGKRTIFSTNEIKPTKYSVFKSESDESKKNPMDFYYQLRNNITHRGKGVGGKSIELNQYIRELKFLIRDLIDQEKQHAINFKNKIDKHQE